MAKPNTGGASHSVLETDAGAPQGSTNLVEVAIHHEISSALDDGTIVETVSVPPSKVLTPVRVVSSVTATAARGYHSRTYMAIQRRRRAQKLLDALMRLETHADDEAIHVYSHGILEICRDAIRFLVPSDDEGNAREIFRLIRDSVMDSRWERYREPHIRKLVHNYAHQLATAEAIDYEIALSAGDEFDEAGLISLPWQHVDDEKK